MTVLKLRNFFNNFAYMLVTKHFFGYIFRYVLHFGQSFLHFDMSLLFPHFFIHLHFFFVEGEKHIKYFIWGVLIKLVAAIWNHRFIIFDWFYWLAITFNIVKFFTLSLFQLPVALLLCFNERLWAQAIWIFAIKFYFFGVYWLLWSFLRHFAIIRI